MARLILKLKDDILKEITFKKKMQITIGRDPSNDIQLDNLSVSRFHARIFKQGWPFYIKDLKSTNGTFLNGRFASFEGLSNNDRITIGKYTIVFLSEEGDYEENPRGTAHPGADMTIRIK